MKKTGRTYRADATSSLRATGVPNYQIAFHADNTPSRPEERYVATSNASASMSPTSTSTEEDALPTPAYESTPVYDEEGAEAPPTPSPLDEFKAEEAIFATLLLELHYSDQLDTPCAQILSFHWAITGRGVPIGPPARSFTLVDSNGVHATSIQYCGCRDAAPEFQQLLRAGIFPGSVKEPKTGFTLILLELFRQYRCQGKSSAYNFALVLQRMTDSFFGDSVPDIYDSLLLAMRTDVDVPLPGEADRPYPNRSIGYLGMQCAACPERGVNMPLDVNISVGSRHLIAHNMTLDGNFKANLFFKRDKGSETALTDGRMYFALESEYQKIAKEHVVHKEDTDVPCNNHIGSIRHQGLVKSGKVARSGVVACACDHTVLGGADRPSRRGGFCIWDICFARAPPAHEFAAARSQKAKSNYLELRQSLFLHQESSSTRDGEGQIPADHINGHGVDCRTIWQAVYFACRGHFYGESAEAIWAFINALGASTRQMTGPGRHDLMNVVFDFWNTRKVYDQAQLLAAERVDALRLFELHMAVVEDLSRQHATDVPAWSRLPWKCTKDAKGRLQSVYQHKVNGVLGIETVVASMIADERVRDAEDAGLEARSSVAQWIRDGIFIDRSQTFVIALLNSHKEHPLPETWTTITSQREKLKIDLKNFRERQRHIYPRLTLSAMDEKEPELTALQLPSYRMKHGQRAASSEGARAEDVKLREAGDHAAM
ncbi:hypothetical protein C8F04DRAFT_1281943 [Mycena alexandri]|uniref:CxC2-like cysteine cluster KDZ transposase-associated domain-containing protein n=1 Tax=Mycena alexandri TaxID=1745969 RepID=A0AAD6RXX9_9AGAR|nr:hypothetical protein C8F04DRAFT_1281943 [Mycena alexandri]